MDFLTCRVLGKLLTELLEALDELIELEILELELTELELERLDDELDKLELSDELEL